MQSAVYSRIGLGICEILLLSSRSHHVMGTFEAIHAAGMPILSDTQL